MVVFAYRVIKKINKNLIYVFLLSCYNLSVLSDRKNKPCCVKRFTISYFHVYLTKYCEKRIAILEHAHGGHLHTANKRGCIRRFMQ